MLRIIYETSMGGDNTFFSYNYTDEFLENFRYGETKMLHIFDMGFFVTLFQKFGIIEGKPSVTPQFFSDAYYCNYDGVEFYLQYDPEFDEISFRVLSDEDPMLRQNLAEKIKTLIETEGPKIGDNFPHQNKD